MSTAFAVFVAVTPFVHAQSAQGIIGLTQTIPSVLSQDFSTCAPAQCFPAGFPAPAVPFGGGTAYDPTTRGVWISDGLRIAKVDPRNQCIYQCPPQPMPNTTANNQVSGLAFSEAPRILWVTDLSGIIRWYSVNGCTLTLINRCIAPLNPGEVLTGIATDDVGGLLYYCTAMPGTPGGILYVSQQGNPCAPFCKFPITSCGGNPMGPLVGAAYDACRRTPFVTDGKRTVRIVVNLTACTFTEVSCCVNTNDPYVGLCVIPSTEVSVGANCTNPVCPVCPAMRHVLTGDPVVGNPSFSWDLINAPAGAITVLVLNVGSCSPPGVVIGSFCAPILVPLAPPPFTSPVLPTGGVGCGGSASVPFAWPNNPVFCGLRVATQFVGVCSSAIGFGTFVSNCITLQVTAT